jgi:hypothetical protein
MAQSEPDTATSPRDRLRALHAFRAMYQNRRFEAHLFDTARGFLQTTLSDDARMPLEFFIEYNNRWWFPLLDRVVVPCVAYDEETERGAIVLAIHYSDTQVLHASQCVEFRGNTISYIRTYASPTFFDRDDDRIRLDRFGNSIWLATGYDLENSARAALLFFDSPAGRAFATHERTRSAVQTIKDNVTQLLASRGDVL